MLEVPMVPGGNRNPPEVPMQEVIGTWVPMGCRNG